MKLSAYKGWLRIIVLQTKRAVHLPWREQTLIAEAFLLLAATRLLLALFPFRRVAAWMGTVSSPLPSSDIALPNLGSQRNAEALAIASAVQRTARFPLLSATCLPQAMAARLMLRRRRIPSVLHFGVLSGGKGSPLLAHAWLQAGTLNITGGLVAENYSEIARVT